MKRVLFLILLFYFLPSFADTYPNRPIRIIVPAPAGGSGDTNIRKMSETLGNYFGQNVVIDNRGTASGNIATEILKNAIPDGHTMMYASGSLITNQVISKNSSYDILIDFIPVTLVAKTSGYFVVVNKQSGIKTIRELVELSKRKSINYASGGFGGSLHLGVELINIRSGAKLFHVPYKGVSAGIAALLNNEIQVTLATPAIMDQYIKNERLVPIAFTGNKRLIKMPNIPTMAESGVPNCVFEPFGQGIFVPAKTSSNIVKKIHSTFVSTIKDPNVIEYFTKGGYNLVGNTPAEFRKQTQNNLNEIKEIVQVAKIKQN